MIGFTVLACAVVVFACGATVGIVLTLDRLDRKVRAIRAKEDQWPSDIMAQRQAAGLPVVPLDLSALDNAASVDGAYRSTKGHA